MRLWALGARCAQEEAPLRGREPAMHIWSNTCAMHVATLILFNMTLEMLLNDISNVIYVIIWIRLYEMGSGGGGGGGIERQGASYTHMALQVMHCLL